MTQRLKDQVKVSKLRNVGFEINRFAKESISEISKTASKFFSQGVGVGHVRGNALVSSDYCINCQIEIAGKILENQGELLWTVKDCGD
ncbi:putative immunity protein [Anaerosphaera multitolerans]|uniref:Imm-5-like domain-containing protein n=1 Tax=Anaerosphaera multitolerans TaxID=2487351 RepID=A0A437S5M9_9FIRM|nr:hypothetical protein [Anaerosphaera multitolerans]RVU54320.1 hypothetical protein EF514_07695 [Anaerosphaera multitolerans]